MLANKIIEISKCSIFTPQTGWSFGASLSDNNNLGFYSGPSLFFTEKNRLVVTGGYSFIKLEKINNANLVAQTDSNNYFFANNADTEIRYIQGFMVYRHYL